MKFDLLFIAPISLLLIFSVVILNSVAPNLFPSYYWYFVFGIVFSILFSLFDFEVISAFSKYLYVISIILLLVTLIIGQVTRETVRWIPIGSFSIQPSEIVRPFLFIFFANYFIGNKLNFKHLLKGLILMALPLLLILVQPSLGVTVITAIGFLGIILASEINKKQLFMLGLIAIILIPVSFVFLAPYQKSRILNFLNPENDPLGAGYNAIQSKISVGSGKIFGMGLGKGVGTQLEFLPEKQTDFIFASISEELGFSGAILVLGLSFLILFRLIKYMENAISPYARAFLSAVFLTLFVQILIHTGMNMGIFPVTGVPYPLVSAGGSSLLATLITLGVVNGTRKI
jgi:rod shape determining protein RodA